jgi:hypothetical protein
VLLAGEGGGVGNVGHLGYDFDVDFFLGAFGQHPDLVERGLALEGHSLDLDGPVDLAHVCVHLLVPLPGSADNVAPFLAFEVLLPRVDGVVGHEKAVELFDRAGKDHFAYLLLLGLDYLGVKYVNLHVGLVNQFVLVGFLRRLALVLVLRNQHLRRQSLFFPEGVNDPVGVVVLEPRKDKLLVLLLALDLMPDDAEAVVGQLGELGDAVDEDGRLLDDAEHVGNEHQVLLADVQPAEEGKVDLEDALVVLEDGLEGEAQVLAHDGRRRLSLLLMHQYYLSYSIRSYIPARQYLYYPIQYNNHNIASHPQLSNGIRLSLRLLTETILQ